MRLGSEPQFAAELKRLRKIGKEHARLKREHERLKKPSGSFLTKVEVFAIPGMGKLFYDGVMMRDYPLIMGILVIGAVLTLVGNLIADVRNALADPRIRNA